MMWSRSKCYDRCRLSRFIPFVRTLPLAGSPMEPSNDGQRFDGRRCLSLCQELQQKAARSGRATAVAELMGLAIEDAYSSSIIVRGVTETDKQLLRPAGRIQGAFSREMIVASARLLLRPRDGVPLRNPGFGRPGLLGDACPSSCSLLPVHLSRDVPFLLVPQWFLAGVPEPTDYYVAYCILNGEWNESLLDVPSRELQKSACEDLIRNGPWTRALRADESRFLRSQCDGD